mgnify:CR=1 FL=1
MKTLRDFLIVTVTFALVGAFGLISDVLALEDEDYVFAAYAETDDGSAEISIFARFYIDPAEPWPS